MRPTAILALSSLLSSACLAGCGPTRSKRQDNAVLAVMGGASLVTVGVLAVAEEEENNCTGGAFCPDLSEDHDLLGALLIALGAGIGGVGVVRLASDPPPEAGEPPTTRPCSRRPARGACATRPPSDRPRTP